MTAVTAWPQWIRRRSLERAHPRAARAYPENLVVATKLDTDNTADGGLVPAQHPGQLRRRPGRTSPRLAPTASTWSTCAGSTSRPGSSPRATRRPTSTPSSPNSPRYARQARSTRSRSATSTPASCGTRCRPAFSHGPRQPAPRRHRAVSEGTQPRATDPAHGSGRRHVGVGGEFGSRTGATLRRADGRQAEVTARAVVSDAGRAANSVLIDQGQLPAGASTDARLARQSWRVRGGARWWRAVL